MVVRHHSALQIDVHEKQLFIEVIADQAVIQRDSIATVSLQVGTNLAPRRLPEAIKQDLPALEVSDHVRSSAHQSSM